MMRLATALVMLLFAFTAVWAWARSGSFALGLVVAGLWVAMWLVGHVFIAEPLMAWVDRRSARRFRREVAALEAAEPELVARARAGDAAALEKVRHRLRYRIPGVDTDYIAGLLVPEAN